MKQITIKKIDDEITYQSITTTRTYEVNGKEVRVYSHDIQDSYTDNYEGDEDIDEDDLEKLTEEEQDVFKDNYSELEKVGEELKVDGWEE